MTKNEDYYVTGVWKDNQARITDVNLHTVNSDTTFQTKGTKTTKASVITLIKNNKVIKTLVWKYPGWNVGAKLTYFTKDGEEFLRSEPDGTTNNNLDNSLPMENLQ